MNEFVQSPQSRVVPDQLHACMAFDPFEIEHSDLPTRYRYDPVRRRKAAPARANVAPIFSFATEILSVPDWALMAGGIRA
jgi:hypothetical protein